MASERFLSLQILRFFAASSVVIAHVPAMIVLMTQKPPAAWFYQPVRIGAAGVDVFFVLSGFVIALTGPLAEPRPTGLVFFWRRWRRVAPFYFLLSAPVAIIAALQGNIGDPAATFLFWPVSHGRLVEPYIVFGWTLSFEMVFYSAMALLLAGGRLRRNLAIGAVILAAGLALRAATGWIELRFLTSPLFLEFGAGVVLANVRGRLAKAPVAVGGLLICAGALAFAWWAHHGVGFLDFFFPIGGFRHDLTRAVCWGVPAALIIAGSVAWEPFCRGAIARLLVAGGDASYSIYLTQSVGLNVVAVLWGVLGLPILYGPLTILGLAMAVAFGSTVYRFIEMPVLRDLKRLRFPRPASAPV